MAKFNDIRIPRVEQKTFDAIKELAKKEKRTISSQALVLIEKGLEVPIHDMSIFYSQLKPKKKK